MKKVKITVAVILAAITIFFVGCTAKKNKVPVIGISQYGEHASLDNCREGFLLGLKEAGLTEGKDYTIDYQNASFVRVRNITLGYNLSGKKLGRVGDYVSSIRVFVDCQNPFTFTKFVGVDPEIKTGGDGSKAEYPMTRTYSFGAKICF